MQSPLGKELQALSDWSEHHVKANIKISKWSVATQIEHCTKSIVAICRSLKKSDPSAYKKAFNFSRLLVFTLGWIPRGRGKVPKAAEPESGADLEALKTYIAKAREEVEDILKLEANAFFYHPYFGDLNKEDSIRFMRIHTQHHLKIIKDIVG